MDQSFGRAVDFIYDATLQPSLWPRALQAVADCFGDIGALLIWRRESGGFGTIVSPGLSAAQADYDASWQSHDPRPDRCFERAFLAPDDVITDHDVMTAQEIATLPIYTHFLARHGLGWFGAVVLSPDTGVFAALSVQRTKIKPYFNSDELRRVENLGRHIERSLRLSIRVFDAENCTLGMREILGRMGIGVFAVDADMNVIFINAVARNAFGAVFSTRDVTSAVLTPAAREKIELALTQASKTDNLAPAHVLIERSEAGPPLTLHVLPVTTGASASHDLLARARGLVLLVDACAGAAPDPALVRDILGLTLGEARVAALIGSGMAPKAAAEKLGIAESTTRTVLKRVFAKAGVSRQSELVALFGKRSLR
jgi:DNA-binding CsgD family transcriptional regulator/PAS domain-containing protein